MTETPDRDGFFRTGVEWMRIADAVRANYPAGDDPVYHAAVTLYREAAWAYLLSRAGQYTLLLGRLRVVLAEVVGGRPDPPRRQERAGVLATAADIFTLLRCAVSVRYPVAFGRPAA